MKYCNNCGVILEDNMQTCPLCGNNAQANGADYREGSISRPETSHPVAEKMSRQQRKSVWVIISVILLSSIIATILVNLIVNKTISWSEYPVAVCLAIFSYISFFAFWPGTSITRLLGGFITSSALLLLLDAFTDGLDWSVAVAIPILLVTSILMAILLEIIRHTLSRGVNLIAYAFVGSAVLCVAIETILSFYHNRIIHLEWSLIVLLCALLVAIVLLFLHFKLKIGRSLEKTFHR